MFLNKDKESSQAGKSTPKDQYQEANLNFYEHPRERSDPTSDPEIEIQVENARPTRNLQQRFFSADLESNSKSNTSSYKDGSNISDNNSLDQQGRPPSKDLVDSRTRKSSPTRKSKSNQRPRSKRLASNEQRGLGQSISANASKNSATFMKSPAKQAGVSSTSKSRQERRRGELLRLIGNGKGVPGGRYSVPVARDPLHPGGLGAPSGLAATAVTTFSGQVKGTGAEATPLVGQVGREAFELHSSDGQYERGESDYLSGLSHGVLGLGDNRISLSTSKKGGGTSQTTQKKRAKTSKVVAMQNKMHQFRKENEICQSKIKQLEERLETRLDPSKQSPGFVSSPSHQNNLQINIMNQQPKSKTI